MITEPRTSRGVIRDSWGDDINVDITEYTVAIPFTGDAILIDHKPVGRAGGRFLGSGLQSAAVSGSTVDLTIKTHGVNPTQVQQAVQGQIAGARDWLTRQSDLANGFVRTWSEMARQDLLRTVVDRQAVLETSSTVMKALGIPLARAKAAVPVTPKPKPLRVAKAAPSGPRSADVEYVMEAIYSDIVETITSLGNAAERLPITNQKLTEEDLRNVILFVLNTNYEGQAVGEAFSGAGKTDILLIWKGRAAFVGECKIWHGEKKFLAAIDQLFGYTTWRDTRVALIIFADPGAMTAVQEKAKAALSEPHQLREGCYWRPLPDDTPSGRRKARHCSRCSSSPPRSGPPRARLPIAVAALVRRRRRCGRGR